MLVANATVYYCISYNVKPCISKEKSGYVWLTDSRYVQFGFFITWCHNQCFDDLLSDSGNEQFGFFITWCHNHCFVMHISHCMSCCSLAVKRWGFYSLFWLLPCFLIPREVFFKVTISSLINLKNVRSFSWVCLPLGDSSEIKVVQPFFQNFP